MSLDKSYAKRAGVFAYGLEMSLQDLSAFDGVGIANTITKSRSPHYVVVADVHRDTVLVVDPFGPSHVTWVPISQMAKTWTGRMLVLSLAKLDVQPSARDAMSRAAATSAPEGSNNPALKQSRDYVGIQVIENPLTIRNDNPGKPLSSTFVLMNTTDAAVHINTISPCCGVTAAVEPATGDILPGQKVQVNVSGVIVAQDRMMSRSILVQASGQNEISIPLTWMIQPPVAWCKVEPSQVNFGTIVRGDKKVLTIAVKSNSNVRVGAVKVDSEALAVQVGDGHTEGATLLTLSLDASMVKYSRLWRNRLWISSADAGLPAVPVEVLAEIDDPVTVTPLRVGFGHVESGESSQQLVSLRFNARNTKVVGIRTSGNSLNTQIMTQNDSDKFAFGVRWNPKSVGLFKETIIVETNNRLQPLINIPCYGIGEQKRGTTEWR